MNKHVTHDRGQEPRQGTADARRMRADARRNRDLILRAASDVFVDHGSDAPLEEIAERAGVGIATLYRRFPDRRALQIAVALDVLTRNAHEARQALAEEPDAFRALVRYMHRALELRIAAVIPALMEQIPMEDAEMLQVREAASQPIQEMIARAQAEGTLRPDVAFGDIGLLIVRLSRPLPGPIPRAMNDRLAHRHLDLLIDGLRADQHRFVTPLPGPAISLANLRAMPAMPSEPGDDGEQVSPDDVSGRPSHQE
ncbi:MAG TPA: helix-turn-helix domain-containing protein [Ktedonobacterales bacterium]